MNERHPTDPKLHPHHPGRGKSTHVVAATFDNAEEGGFIMFFPSGAFKQVSWRQIKPITPTLDAAKKFAEKVIEALQRDGLAGDIDRTNWASATAAIQRIVLDWNDAIGRRIGIEMSKRFRDGASHLLPH